MRADGFSLPTGFQCKAGITGRKARLATEQREMQPGAPGGTGSRAMPWAYR